MQMLFDGTREELATGLDTQAQSGARFVLGRMAQDAVLIASPCGVEWAAYMMATVEHETARRFLPVEEVGRGQGNPYGVTLKVACTNRMRSSNCATRLGTAAQGAFRENVYYGRGYVQLTWQSNYAQLGQALGMGRLLMEEPELALEPETAYAVMTYGMTRGAFTGKRLGDYLCDGMKDYVQARRVVNGLDCAAEIAELATAWEARLRAAVAPAAQAA